MAGFEFDPVSYAMGRKSASGGESVIVKSLDVTTNGTYEPASGMAYAPVTVNVPNSYDSGDEGKVVSNGALVSQTAHAIITQNGVFDTTLNNTVEVFVKESDPTSNVRESDVNFFDYDGSIVHSYTATEFAAMSSLPNNPSHAGLTGQGWGYTLAQAKAYVIRHGSLDMGQAYTTADSGTHIFISLKAPRLSPTFGISLFGTATLDWGDGSDPISLNANGGVLEPHTYASEGDYEIVFTVNSGYATIPGTQSAGSGLITRSLGGASNYVYQGAVTGVHIGANCNIGNYAFTHCHALKYVTIPVGVTAIGDWAFAYCSNLEAVIMPNSIRNVGANAFIGCYGLYRALMAPGVYGIASRMFYNCASLSGITLPETATGIGSEAFYGCASMKFVVIPENIASVGTYAFTECKSLKAIDLRSDISSIGSYAFLSCSSLASAVLPDGITSVSESAFSGCYSLSEVIVPARVTQVGQNAFNSCAFMRKFTVPAAVTSIGGGAFLGCSGLGELHFKSATPPTASSSTVFQYLPTDCKIYVPSGRLSVYTSATNYPSSSTYTYVEE